MAVAANPRLRAYSKLKIFDQVHKLNTKLNVLDIFFILIKQLPRFP